MNSKNNLKLSLALIASLSLGACAIHSEPAKLSTQLPSAWQETASPEQTLSDKWWLGFNSAELNRLIDVAIAESPDVAIAVQRISQAEAAVQTIGTSLFPSLDLSGGTTRQRTNRSGQGTSTGSSTNASLGVSYEVDLWGRVRANVRASEAFLESSRYDLETARLTLISGVANAYFQVLSTRVRLDIANNNLATAERLLRIVDARYRNGVASALDLSRQQTAVLTQRNVVLPLEVQVRQNVTALAILTGRIPQGFQVGNENLQSIAIPEITPGLPAELLQRRPDLASAEAQLRSADADVDAARAALFPSLQLTASGGVASSALLSLADPTKTLSIGASLAQSIFDGGRLRSQVRLSEAQRLQLLETYRKSVLTALKEVEDGLSNVSRYQREELAQIAIRNEAERSLRLAELRYKEGADDLSTVLDAQRTLYSAEDSLAQVRVSRLNSSIDMAKALGGGWQQNLSSEM